MHINNIDLKRTKEKTEEFEEKKNYFIQIHA